MINHPKTLRALIAFVLTVAFAVPAFADTLKLKDGSIIKGRIVSYGDGKFTILIGSGSRQRQMVFFADEVESIEFDGIGPTVARANAPSYNDASVSRAAQVTTPNPTPTPSVTPRPTSTPSSSSVGTQSPIPAPTPTQAPASSSSGATTSRAVVINVKVLADNSSNGWTNSGLVVKKGQRIRITGTGRVSLGPGKNSTPAGVPSLADGEKLMPGEATGGLIAVIGDDNNDFIFIGTSKDFVATRDGALFLGVNEGKLDDNSGSFDVTIEADPR